MTTGGRHRCSSFWMGASLATTSSRLQRARRETELPGELHQTQLLRSFGDPRASAAFPDSAAWRALTNRPLRLPPRNARPEQTDANAKPNTHLSSAHRLGRLAPTQPAPTCAVCMTIAPSPAPTTTTSALTPCLPASYPGRSNRRETIRYVANRALKDPY